MRPQDRIIEDEKEGANTFLRDRCAALVFFGDLAPCFVPEIVNGLILKMKGRNIAPLEFTPKHEVEFCDYKIYKLNAIHTGQFVIGNFEFEECTASLPAGRQGIGLVPIAIGISLLLSCFKG